MIRDCANRKHPPSPCLRLREPKSNDFSRTPQAVREVDRRGAGLDEFADPAAASRLRPALQNPAGNALRKVPPFIRRCVKVAEKHEAFAATTEFLAPRIRIAKASRLHRREYRRPGTFLRALYENQIPSGLMSRSGGPLRLSCSIERYRLAGVSPQRSL